MRALIVLSLLLIGYGAHAQGTIYPDGCYMAFKELQKGTPSKKCKLLVEEYVDKVFIDIRLLSKDKCLTTKEIWTELLAYSDSGKLYLNCVKMGLYPLYTTAQRYSEAMVLGDKYLVFYGTQGSTVPAAASRVNISILYERDLYAIEMITGKLYYVTPDYMETL